MRCNDLVKSKKDKWKRQDGCSRKNVSAGCAQFCCCCHHCCCCCCTPSQFNVNYPENPMQISGSFRLVACCGNGDEVRTDAPKFFQTSDPMMPPSFAEMRSPTLKKTNGSVMAASNSFTNSLSKDPPTYGMSVPSQTNCMGSPPDHLGYNKTMDYHGYARLVEDPFSFTVTSIFPKTSF